ncbi:hypothetical protein KKG83_04410 [Candidatus Micrarchaeota archaeon]|nr:hypothetical protein [Candidatus Micrarchaeota archaeon]
MKKKIKMFEINNPKNVVLEHESPVRKIVSQAQNTDYKPIKTFEEAKKFDDSYLIMEGDYGGQIYLSTPVKLIKCDIKTLEKLLKELDKIAWDCNEGMGCGIYFERKKVGEGIWGGMGGGIALNELWVHEEFKDIKGKILNILNEKENPQ